MKRTNQLAFSVLTSFTVLSIGFFSSALAETITITRGPNGAAHQVKADNIPLDAQVRPNTPATSVPSTATKGPNGGAQIAQTESVSESSSQSAGNLKVITRGPNSAAHIAN